MGERTVEYEAEGHIAVVRLNRPDRLNALNRQLQDELGQAFAAAEAARDVRVLILTGAGRAFSVGADIEELETTAEGAARQLQASLACLSSPERLRKPVIAAVNGYALGGGFELALACDIVVASDRAVFSVPEPTLGVVPGLAMQRLPRLVGVMRAREILLTARRLSAQEAREYGLVSRVAPHDDLMEQARSVAMGMTELAPLALELLKATINRNLLSSDLVFAERANAWLFTTRDAREGIRAFREKRKPNFSG
ncbi:MAG: enoyl-CoA hydratase/isomerase family protein [Candidatus Rokubacteria bacterium]|nr:enoyl-CoA hydratase/isomerase family protein [Candidatus Rokubacteria bacterium]